MRHHFRHSSPLLSQFMPANHDAIGGVMYLAKKCKLTVGLVFVLSGLAYAQSAYVDTFETPTIIPGPFWTLTQQYGTVRLAPGINHSYGGHQALQLSSTSGGGQREILATHTFASPQKGTFMVWFYDVAPGQETQYEQLRLYNSVTTDGIELGTQDFDAYCYMAEVYNVNNNQVQGPNQNCGIYPQVTTTNVQRTVGWHSLSIFVGTDSVTLAIDGSPVFTTSGNYSYDSITLNQSGPGWRPDTYSYWDDFAAPVWLPN